MKDMQCFASSTRANTQRTYSTTNSSTTKLKTVNFIALLHIKLYALYACEIFYRLSQASN